MSIEDIRARCGKSVTEMVANPKEYYRVQQLLRDRAELLAAYDQLKSCEEVMRAALMKYGRHHNSCPATGEFGDGTCRCGLRDAIAQSQPQPDHAEDDLDPLGDGIPLDKREHLPSREFCPACAKTECECASQPIVDECPDCGMTLGMSAAGPVCQNSGCDRYDNGLSAPLASEPSHGGLTQCDMHDDESY